MIALPSALANEIKWRIQLCHRRHKLHFKLYWKHFLKYWSSNCSLGEHTSFKNLKLFQKCWPVVCVCLVNVISPSVRYSWVNISVDPGTTFLSTNQIWRTSLQFKPCFGSQSGLGASTSVLFTYIFLWF